MKEYFREDTGSAAATGAVQPEDMVVITRTPAGAAPVSSLLLTPQRSGLWRAARVLFPAHESDHVSRVLPGLP